MKKWIAQGMAMAMLAGLLAACGGGNDSSSGSGGSSPTPSATTQAPVAPANLSVTYDVKTYQLAWSAAPGATNYEVWEDPDGHGSQPATRIASGVTDLQYTHTLPVLLDQRVAANYTVKACNDAGCSAPTDPVRPDVLKAVGVFGTANSGGLGSSVAISRDGLTLVVGATGDRSSATGIDGDAADTSRAPSETVGAVYVFAKVNGTWTRQAYIKAPTASMNNGAFGMAVAISGDGNTVAVGSPIADLTRPAGDTAIQIYTRSGGTWSRQGSVIGSNTENSDRFGIALALSTDGNTLVAGADSESSAARGINVDGSDNSALQAGAAYVFTRSGSTWTQQAYVKASNADRQDFFGTAVAVSGDGNLLVVGAPGEQSRSNVIDGDQADNTLRSGATYVFRRTGATWAQEHYLKPKNTGSARNFGFQVAIAADGSTIAVGAPSERSGSRGINGSTTSAPETASTGVGSGAAWVFVATDTSWSLQAYLKASNADQFDAFGANLSLSANGNVLAVGAAGERSSAVGFNGSEENAGTGANGGAAYVFRRTGTTWNEAAYVKAPTLADGAFAAHLALSADGNSLAATGQGKAFLY